jgi:hypothetical protein
MSAPQNDVHQGDAADVEILRKNAWQTIAN